jgi:hypothetical protein
MTDVDDPLTMCDHLGYKLGYLPWFLNYSNKGDDVSMLQILPSLYFS